MELLVVIAVIVILAGILFPVYAQARDAARRAHCLSNLRQIALSHRIYVQDHDDVLPYWYVGGDGGYLTWPEFMRPYYREARILDQGFGEPSERLATAWLADYALCAWGTGGDGTPARPYWRWPGPLSADTEEAAPLSLCAVRRPSETMQFVDGITGRYASMVQALHRNGGLNGAFLDGHARFVSEAAWNRVDRDEVGYFYRIAAADR
jgi:prepilin-type processing-associated H-X9-DG protein